MRLRETVQLEFLRCVDNPPGAMIRVNRGEKTTPKRVTTNRTPPASVNATWVSSLVSFSGRWARYSPYTGIKETVKAPSPTSRLQRLGIRKATKKASAAMPAPKKWAITASLRNQDPAEERPNPDGRSSSRNRMLLRHSHPLSFFIRHHPTART